MADDIKVVVTQAAPAPVVEAEKSAEPVKLCDSVAIISYVESKLLKIPGNRSRTLYPLAEGDRGYNKSCITFKLTTDYTVEDEQVITPWKEAFNMRLWQHNAEAAKNKTPSGWLKDNLTCEVSETVQYKYWSFKFPCECLSVLREKINVEKGAAVTGTRKVTDFY